MRSQMTILISCTGSGERNPEAKLFDPMGLMVSLGRALKPEPEFRPAPPAPAVPDAPSLQQWFQEYSTFSGRCLPLPASR